MSSHRNAIVISLLLVLVILLMGDSLGVVAAPPSLTINQLVTSGQTVTLNAPQGNYYYQWAADTGGSIIGMGTARTFSFSAPLVSQEEVSKQVHIYLYIRTIEGGCVNETNTTINVYPLPVCGIDGPGTVGPYDVSTYTYSGGTTGQLTFEWTADGKKIDGATGPSVDIDWSQYNVANHTIVMTLTKDYSDVAPGSTNPFRSITCTYYTNVTYTTGMELAKVATPGTASVGDTVTYTYTVRNTGTIGITALQLTDNKLGTITLSPTTILPGEQATATKTYVIAESDLPGPLNNTAIVSGKEDKTNKPTNTTTNETVSLTYNASLALTKAPSVETAAVGDTVTYTYTVENTGEVTINDLNLADDKLGAISIAKNSLKPGETTTGTASHVVLESDLPGPLVNNATITGTDSQNKSVTANANASVALTYQSSLALTKTASSGTAAVGETITYEYSITNNGSVTVSGLALNDDKLGTITLGADTLAPGESTTGSATYTVSETDLPGPLVNIATATGTNSQGGAVSTTATQSVELTYTSSMEVTKTPSTNTANVGDTLTYTYAVRNTGTVTINSLALQDDKLGAITLNQTTLAPGETASGTATHTVVETDLPGPLTNTVTATGTNVLGTEVTSQATATVQLTYTANLRVTKTPSADTAAIGETVTYQYAVENIGNVTISGLTLLDDKLGAITLSTDTLAAGETATGTATHTIVEADLPGPLTNTATAAGKDVLGKDVTSQGTATVSLTYNAALEVAKTPSSTTAAVGDTVTYTYTVRNSGNVNITTIALSDNRLGAITLDRTTLGPGETATGTASYTVLETDLPGPLTNTATATAKDSVGKDVTGEASASVELTYAASITIAKAASTDSAAVGDTITYTYTVENTGKVTISSLNLADDKLGAINLAKDSLKPGETTTGTASHVVLESDLPGPLVNNATITGTDSQNNPVTANANASVALTYQSSLALTKTASSGTAAVGETITYEYSITNSGSVTVSGLALNDDKLGPITLGADTLAPGESTTGSATYTVSETDLPGPLVNIATATGTNSQGGAVSTTATQSVELTYTSSMEVTKTPSTNTANVGDTVTYTYEVRNTGTVTINSLALQDDKLGAITLNQTTLAPGETASGTATHTVVETDLPGPLTNTVNATGTNVLGTEVTSQATATVQLTYTANLRVTKTPSADTAAIGETVTYQYAVENIGTVTISGLTLLDDKLGTITLSTDTLAAGETATGTATHTIVEADLPGPLTNTATAAGKDVLGKDVTSQGTATVSLTYNAALEVAKTPSSTTAAVGDTVTYTYTVRNSGNVNITTIALSDNRLGAITLDRTALGPGETATGTASYTVLETDLPGPLTNTATATAKDSVGKDVTGEASASVELTYAASITIAKAASTDSAAVGDSITYTYTVENTGKVTINDLAVSDNKLGTISMSKTTLLPGETVTATATYTVLETDIPGPLTNVVTATATDRLGQPLTATDTATVALTYNAAMAVTKTVAPQSATIGDTVTYTFTVTNTGKVTIHGITLSDDKLGTIALADDTIGPGESTTATANHVLAEADLPSPLTNVVTATGLDIQEQTLTSTATATVTLTYTSSAITLTKTASSRSAKVGDTVTYTYTITNNNKVTISSLSLEDDKLGTIALSQDTIAPGATITATATYVIAVEDVPGPVINNATLTGMDPGGNGVTATASARVAITRDPVTPVLICVHVIDQHSFTAFFGYNNPNSYPVTVAIGNDNKFSPKPDDRGQPTTFEPGSSGAILAITSPENSLVWHLENTVAEANKNSQGCSQPECGVDGPALCRNREETYSYTKTEDPKFTYSYNWTVDDIAVGTGKEIVLNGANYQEGEYLLKVVVSQYFKNALWSTNECSMTLKVIPEPAADISMEET